MTLDSAGSREKEPVPDSSRSLPDTHFTNLAEVEETYWWHVSRILWAEHIINRCVDNPSSSNVLDFGCGTGGFLQALNKRMRFRSCLGVDVSAVAIEHAKRRGDNYQCSAFSDLSEVSGKDIVFLMDVLEHVEDDALLLTSIIKELKPGGFLLLSVPASPRLYSSWDETLGHYRRYTMRQVCSLVERAGGSLIYKRHAFAYLIPLIYWKRVLQGTTFDDHSCTFPPVPKAVNSLFLCLTRLELASSRFFNMPWGSSLFCLVGKTPVDGAP